MFNLLVIGLNLISIILVYIGLELTWLPVFNISFFLIWILSLNWFTGIILSKILSFSISYSRLLGIFLNIFLLGFIVNVFTSWLAFSNLAIFLSLLITSLIIFFWSYFFSKTTDKLKVYLGNNEGFWKVNNFIFIPFLGLIILGFYIIFLSQTGDYLVSPWQVLSFDYLAVVMVLLLVVFYLVFSNKKVWLILAAIILLSFLMHAYLLVYSEGFGGDRWRHIGSENRILAEITYQPTLLTNDIWYQNIFGIKIPRALVAGPKISYGFQWSLIAMTSKITSFDVYVLDKYFGFILWSLFLPLISFVLAFQIKARRRYALLASALTLVFYLLQYYGSQTLPISFSVLYFLFLISCFLAYLKNKQNIILYFLTFLTIISYFSYVLSFIILVISLVWLLSVNFSNIKKYFIFITLGLVIFLADFFSGLSNIRNDFNFANIWSDVFVGGNFLFFEVGDFLIQPIKYWSLLSLSISLMVGIFILISIFKNPKNQKPISSYFICLFFILTFNYLSSWILLDGLHSLARRMNLFIVSLLVFILAFGLYSYVTTKLRAVVAILALSLLGILTYSSGPVLEASVTKDDTMAMQYVWSILKDNSENHCVLADTWPLLALEAYSAKEVIAGNFPSDFDYSQNERVTVLENFILNPSLNLVDRALVVTKSKSCFIVINSSKLNGEKIKIINNILASPMVFGNNFVWQYK